MAITSLSATTNAFYTRAEKALNPSLYKVVFAEEYDPSTLNDFTQALYSFAQTSTSLTLLEKNIHDAAQICRNIHRVIDLFASDTSLNAETAEKATQAFKTFIGTRENPKTLLGSLCCFVQSNETHKDAEWLIGEYKILLNRIDEFKPIENCSSTTFDSTAPSNTESHGIPWKKIAVTIALIVTAPLWLTALLVTAPIWIPVGLVYLAYQACHRSDSFSPPTPDAQPGELVDVPI